MLSKMKHFLVSGLMALALAVPLPAWAVATLLPNGEQVFLDDNGDPLALGWVYFYIPTTSTPKATWQDASQSVLNTNPVHLDAAGRAIIYGSGQYRQVVTDSVGVQIWDQTTQDLLSLLNGNAIVWGGTSTGTANAQIISPSPAVTSLAAGQFYSFLPGNANTSGVTLQVSALAPVALKKRGTAGLQSLVTADLLTGQSYVVMYDGTQFELVNQNVAINSIASIVSATTTDLGTVANLNVAITASNTINSFGSSAIIGDIKLIGFSGGPTLTYNATSMILPGAANIVTVAGDTAMAVYLGSGNWRVSTYTRGAVAPGSTATTIKRRTITAVDTVLTSDQGNILEATSGTFTETIIAPATVGNGFWFIWKNSGTGNVTLSPAAGTIDGLASYLSYPNESRIIQTDGTNYFSTVIEPFAVTYTAGATFTQPPGYKGTIADAIGGGGGGGGGRGSTAGTVRSGGGGGGGAEHIRGGPFVITANTAVTVTVGAAGTAGTGGSSGNGVTGGTGGTSSFGSYILAHGGVGGTGGTNATSVGGGAAGCLANIPRYYNGVAQQAPLDGALAWGQLCGLDGSFSDTGTYGDWAGGQGGNGDTAATAGAGFTSRNGGGAGGGGGGVSSGNTERAGGAGGAGNTWASTGGGGAGGATNGGVGTAGSAGTLGNGANGGGGGGGQDSGTGGVGGAGGAAGGGGGGGGAGTSTGGAGGLGGLGQVIVWGM